MEAVYECKEPRLQKGLRHSIVAKDACGNIVGTYYGFWAPGLRIITLYPDHNHPAFKPGWKLIKKKVYDGCVRCSSKPAIAQIANVKPEPKGETWRDRKLPMQGQEAMKF